MSDDGAVLGRVLEVLARVLDELEPDARAAVAADVGMRRRIEAACQALHVLHAAPDDSEVSPSPRGPVVVVERTWAGTPKRTVPAESPTAALHWDERAWKSL